METLQTMYEGGRSSERRSTTRRSRCPEPNSRSPSATPRWLNRRFAIGSSRVTDEYERAADYITEIGRRDQLHTRDWLGENLERRNPYVDPLNMLQIYLLDRTHRTDIEERTLRLTVKGIAAGMKNTG